MMIKQNNQIQSKTRKYLQKHLLNILLDVAFCFVDNILFIINSYQIQIIHKQIFDSIFLKSNKKFNNSLIRTFTLSMILLTLFDVSIIAGNAFEDHECYNRDSDSCHFNHNSNGTTQNFLCVWCEYWCVHNAKELQSGEACEEYSDKFAQVFNPPTIIDVKPSLILTDTPTLISINGEFFDKHTSTYIYNTVTEINFHLKEIGENYSQKNKTNISLNRTDSTKHFCKIHSQNFTNIRCVLEGINGTLGEVHIALQFHFKRVIYEYTDESIISFDYKPKIVNTIEQNEMQNISNVNVFNLTSSQILIGTFILGVCLSCLSCLIYTKRKKIIFLNDKLRKNYLIFNIRKELIKQELLIDLKECKFNNKLGNGQFGHVFAAIISGSTVIENSSTNSDSVAIESDNESSIKRQKVQFNNSHVAIKQLKNANTDAQTINLFVDEGIRMSKIHHQNILTPLGITFDAPQIDSEMLQVDNSTTKNDRANIENILKSINQPSQNEPKVGEKNVQNKKNFFKILFSNFQPSIILPIMINGDLCRYLRSQKLFPISSLVNFSRQIADGMSHLSSLKIVHGDLASRNCLLDENFMIKIADFGFTRRMYDSEEYSILNRPSWPVRWMSPEQLSDVDKQRVKFTYASDIWAFGIVMWEIFTLGSHPYDEFNDDEILSKLLTGFRLAPPPDCPSSVGTLMLSCWNIQPEQRPKFIEIYEHLFSVESSFIRASSSSTVSPFLGESSNSQTTSRNSLSSESSYSSTSSLSFPSSSSTIFNSHISKEQQDYFTVQCLNDNNSKRVSKKHLKLQQKLQYFPIDIETSKASDYITLPDRCFASHNGQALSTLSA